MGDMIRFEEVEKRVLTVRGQQVLIDKDLAELYGVETREVNQAVKNNADKFPQGYIFALNKEEKTELIKNFDQFNPLKHAKAMPNAFTEKGLYMLATILKSPQATETTLAIVETFAKMRELSRVINQLPDLQDESQQKTLMQRSAEILADVLDDGALSITGDETTVELNLAMLKVKHTVKREKRKD